MAKKLIPQRVKLLVTIVNKGKGNFYYDQIESFGANMQLLVDGTGTGSAEINNMWADFNKDRDVILSFVPEDNANTILKMLDEKFETVRQGSGIAFSVPISSIIGVKTYQFLVDNRAGGLR